VSRRDAPRTLADEGAAARTGLLQGSGLRAAARTDRGKVRQENEDAFVCRPDLGLFAVIDGMGGQQAGRRAASLTREALLAESDLVKALGAANERIHDLAQKDPALAGMGCVASGVRVTNGAARIAHVGDTRVYVASNAGCEQLTRDHTVAASRQEDLGISHRGAREMAGHNQVTRDIGGRPQSDDQWIDRLEVPLEDDSILLLCSDGLYGAVPGDELFARLRQARRIGTSPDALANELVELALTRGARDNVTAVVVAPAPDDGGEKGTKAPRMGTAAVLALFALGVGLGLAAHPYVFDAPAPASAVPVGAMSLPLAAGADGRLAPGADLAGVVNRSGEVVALGPIRWPGDGTLTTEIANGVVLDLRGVEIRDPLSSARWVVQLGAGSRLNLKQAAIHAPGLALEVVESADSRLEIVDSSLTLRSLTVRGPGGSRVVIRGGRVVFRDGPPQVSGPSLEWDHPQPAPGAEEAP